MQANTALPGASRPRRRADPVETALCVAVLATVAGELGLELLQVRYGIGEEWWLVAGCVVFSAGSLALLWSARRRFLSRPPLEPGADEASWRAAEHDRATRDRLRHRGAVALVALGVAFLPFGVLWWEGCGLVAGVVAIIVIDAVATGLVSRRAKPEGTFRVVAGSRPPAGWSAFGAVAVGLPLAWSPLVLMASAARSESLLLFAIPALHAYNWWRSRSAWGRPLQVDPGSTDDEIDGLRRQRDARIAKLPWLTLVLDYFLVAALGTVTLDELTGLGCAASEVVAVWWMVVAGTFGTGWAFFTRPVRAAASQPPDSPSRQPAAASAARPS